MNTKRILIFEDSGHSWGRVSKLELKKLGIADRISPYSYQYNAFAYLEEDCDLPEYIAALQQRGISPALEVVSSVHRSRIRTFDHYKI